MYENHKIYETEVAGRKLLVETGKHAQLANGACLVRYGGTAVLATITASSAPKPGLDYFPLSVDYEERMYAIGKIPGGFKKREGRPTDSAVLTSRLIDRPIRPLFPKDYKNEVGVVCTVLSVEQNNQPEVAAMLGAAIAIAISDVPFNGPIAGVIIGYVDGKIVLNPNAEQREKGSMYVTLVGTKEKICMIEAGANEVPDEIMLQGIKEGHQEIKRFCEFIDTIVGEIGKEKASYQSGEIPAGIFDEIKEFAYDDMRKAVLSRDKSVREISVDDVTKKTMEAFGEKYKENPSYVTESLYNLEKKVVREYILKEGVRVDGRKLDTIRELHSEVSVLPRTHGSALFQRGQTQVLSTVTLSSIRDSQTIDGLDASETENRYMHHYNFPGYSVGDPRGARGPGRREIGHGALAEKALECVIPSKEDFPYAIRVVSDVLMSNGSTSQGSICGSTLALMDAGVPIKAPVAGISCGLITDDENPDKYVLIMDIQGIEDFFGDMDFKVAGTTKGITAIQVDIKTDGLTEEMIEKALEITRKGRIQILEESMLKAIDKPRPQLSVYAPKIITMTIDTDKIKDVIGSGGKVINKIIETTGVKIDIEDDGTVYISTTDSAAADKAVSIIKGLTSSVEPGMIFYNARVTKIMSFGAFVEFLPGKEGLVHISQLAHERVNTVEELLKVNDTIDVKIIEVDRQGRINLSRKVLLPRPDRKDKEE
ncbi:MAG: polyribonucleotide nucleotidyltransferase [Clostridia bacterium]